MNCECGCGQQTKIGRNGANRYVHGHNPKPPRPPGPGWLDQGRWYLSVQGLTIARARLVMQQVLGRALHSDEVVVHVGDPLNDHPSNLQVVSRAEYMRVYLPRMAVQQWSTQTLVAA